MENSARQQAKNAGQKTYVSDKPCKRGHIAPRLVCNAICTECQRIHNASFYEKTLKHQRRTTHKDRVRESNKRYETRNPGRHSAYAKTPGGMAVIKRISEKRRSTPEGKIHARIRTAIRRSLASGKSARTFSVLGYTLQDLMLTLERQFLPGMGWHNISDWHIDHIVPLCDFNVIDATCQEFKAAWSLGNLRPMWADKNREKGSKRVFLI